MRFRRNGLAGFINPSVKTIPSNIWLVAKHLVLWATMDYSSWTCSRFTWPPSLACLPSFFWLQNLVAGEPLGGLLSEQQGGHEAGVGRRKGERRDMNWALPHVSFGPIQMMGRCHVCVTGRARPAESHPRCSAFSGTWKAEKPRQQYRW